MRSYTACCMRGELKLKLKGTAPFGRGSAGDGLSRDHREFRMGLRPTKGNEKLAEAKIWGTRGEQMAGFSRER